MNIAIVILNYHGLTDTLDCLKSILLVKTPHNFNIFVVNIAPRNNSTSIISNQYPQVTVLESNDNLGFAGGNNLAIRKALPKNPAAIMLLNNDTVVKKDFLAPLVKKLKTPRLGAISPKIYFSPGKEFHRQSYKPQEKGKIIWYAGGYLDWNNVYARHIGVDEFDHGQFNTPKETDFATGCCMLVPTSVINKIGLLNEKYFLYFEDIDWCLRMRRQNLSIWYEPQSIIWHKNAGSTHGSGSNLHVYYQTRNRILFGAKYASLKTKFALVKESVKKLKKGTNIEQKAIKDALALRFGKQYE